MVQEIGTAIVMFLLGSVLTYFSTRWSKTLAKIDCLEFGMQSILRDRMTQMHRYYKDKQKAIPQQEVDSFEQMFSAYKRLAYISNCWVFSFCWNYWMCLPGGRIVGADCGRS